MFEGWICKNCKTYNDLLTNYCVSCYGYKPEHITSVRQAQTEIRRGIYLQYGIYSSEVIMTEQEELFAKFYNHEKLLVKDMDSVQLREHREELSKIAFEAKARLVANDDETRERSANTKVKDWSLSPSGLQTESDAINAPAVRKSRMSKLDKQRSDLLKIGIDEAIVNEMMAKMEKRATEKDVKAISFKAPATEDKVIIVNVSKEPSEPFNPSNIKFGS